MNQKLGQYLPGARSLYAALAISALAAIGSPGTASANSTANTTILNTVRVDYRDATGTNSFSASASASVTVNLVKAPLNTFGAPTGANGSPALVCLGAFDAPASGIINSLYALTATANGSDTYNFSMPAPTPHNVTGQTATYSILKSDGTLENLAPATRVLGSAIPTRVVSDTVLEFPGGALAGFAIGDMVTVQTTGGPKAFLVTGVTAGQAPVYSNGGGTAYSVLGTMTLPEIKGTLTLGPWANTTYTLNTAGDTTFGGGNTAPTFNSTNPATLGLPVAEMVLVKVAVSAQSTLVDGTVDFALNMTAQGGTNPSQIGCNVGTFKAPTLSIKKEARNFTQNGAFGGTANGNPGEILEYKVTVSNAGGQAAQVVVADAVPAYTTLVAFGTGYLTGAPTNTVNDFFARINNGLANYDMTRSAVDSETNPVLPLAKVGYGKATGVTATSPITFYLGDGSTNAAGGKIPACSDTTYTTSTACTTNGKTWITSYTILYQVKID